MEPLKGLVSNFMLDIDDYLYFVGDYGRPNPKYFNYVLIKRGIMMIFLHKSRVFKSFISVKFVESVLSGLKSKFIQETSRIKQAAIIFLFSKIFATDDVAIGLKLRTTGEEWKCFKAFLDDVKDDVEYQDICIMLYFLYTESFFRFTIKSKKLALDFGTPETTAKNLIDPAEATIFWKEVKNDLIKMQHTDVQELKQLAEIRDKALKPFDELLPEKVSINEALESFEMLSDAVTKLSAVSPKKTNRKEVIQTCKDYIIQSRGFNEDRNITGDSDADYESITNDATTSRKKKKRSNKNQSKKKNKKQQSHVDEVESGVSDDELRQLSRKHGFQTQKILMGMGAFGFYSDKLKKYYE